MNPDPAPDKNLTDPMEDWRQDRLRFVAETFAAILPVYSKNGQAFTRRVLGTELGELMPRLMTDIFLTARLHKKATLEYINWIKEACEYVLDPKAAPPQVHEQNPEDQHG